MRERSIHQCRKKAMQAVPGRPQRRHCKSPRHHGQSPQGTCTAWQSCSKLSPWMRLHGPMLQLEQKRWSYSSTLLREVSKAGFLQISMMPERKRSPKLRGSILFLRPKGYQKHPCHRKWHGCLDAYFPVSGHGRADAGNEVLQPGTGQGLADPGQHGGVQSGQGRLQRLEGLRGEISLCDGVLLALLHAHGAAQVASGGGLDEELARLRSGPEAGALLFVRASVPV